MLYLKPGPIINVPSIEKDWVRGTTWAIQEDNQLSKKAATWRLASTGVEEVSECMWIKKYRF